jgi:predicted Zn-dependent peptidase
VDDDQISGSAGQFLTNYYLSQETNAAQAGELARYEILGGGWKNSFEFINRIREVKPADVRAVANKYMRNLRFVVIGNPSSVNKAVFIPAE